jgi:hypothetical protein
MQLSYAFVMSAGYEHSTGPKPQARSNGPGKPAEYLNPRPIIEIVASGLATIQPRQPNCLRDSCE